MGSPEKPFRHLGEARRHVYQLQTRIAELEGRLKEIQEMELLPKTDSAHGYGAGYNDVLKECKEIAEGESDE